MKVEDKDQVKGYRCIIKVKAGLPLEKNSFVWISAVKALVRLVNLCRFDLILSAGFRRAGISKQHEVTNGSVWNSAVIQNLNEILSLRLKLKRDSFVWRSALTCTARKSWFQPTLFHWHIKRTNIYYYPKQFCLCLDCFRKAHGRNLSTYWDNPCCFDCRWYYTFILDFTLEILFIQIQVCQRNM